MNSESLPASGPAKELFLRALRDYSENCTAPDLTPGCPFAIETADGRGCGEECMDLLAQHQAPLPIEEVRLGDAISVRPRVPRPRHEPRRPERPFDAREHVLEDTGKAIEDRRITTLVSNLQESLVTPPADDPVAERKRFATIAVLMEQLDARGFDVEPLVRHLARDVATSICVGVAIPLILELTGENFESAVLEVRRPPKEWRLLLAGSDTEGDSPATQETIDAVFAMLPHVVGWLQVASLDSILHWKAPDSDEELRDARPARGGVREEVAAWIVDRSSATYLDEWDTRSLHLEWEYQRGTRTAPCFPREMRARRVPSNELVEAIANRAVLNENERSRVSSANAYVGVAVEMLNDGRRSAASAIFEGIARVSPVDPIAHNNLGFCLLLDAPKSALAALEKSASLGYAKNSMNIANRMFGLARLGRFTAALDLAEGFYQIRDEDTASSVPSFLWDYCDYSGQPVLVEVDNPQEYVWGFAARLASEKNEVTLAEVWNRRRRGPGASESA